jgi:uncharacterized protein (DUF488 family)
MSSCAQKRCGGRCHRAIITDVLCVRGIEMVHILDTTHTVVHPHRARPTELCAGKYRWLPEVSR